MRARYILPRDRYTPCTRMQEGVYLPTYSTIRQTRCYKSWPGVARVVLTRNARWKEMAAQRERERKASWRISKFCERNCNSFFWRRKRIENNSNGERFKKHCGVLKDAMI